MQLPPLKPRSPHKAGRRVTLEPLLPRSFSHPTFPRLPPSEALLDRLQRHRPMRNALLFLISLVLAANCVWAVQGLAAWRRGGGEPRGAGDERLLFQRLKSTTLSVEVLREGGSKDGEAAGRSTYLLNAQLVDKANSTQQAQQALQALQALQVHQASSGRRERTERAAAAAVDAAVRAADQGAGDLVGRLREMGTALTGALAAGVESWMHGGRDDSSSSEEASKADAAAGGDGEAKPAAAAEESKSPGSEKAPPPPSPPPHRAVLKMPEVEERSRDACAQALRLPRVALLFLTRGDLYHHETWAAWFRAAQGQLPVRQLRAAACPAVPAPAPDPEAAASRRLLGEEGSEAAEDRKQREQREQGWPQGSAGVAAACGWNASTGRALPAGGDASPGASGPIDQQHLFSVYVHAPPDVTDKALPPLFRGRLIPDRLQPEWGTHQLVEATRNLLWEAFKDPLNEHFVLLSESDIPLYDPLTLHQQLLAEGKSRVNACRHAAPTDPRRWSWRMASPQLKAWHWRKSSQWFGLLRRHVEVVLQDVEVFRRFEEHCRNGWDGDYKRWRDCYSDEHYIPTLLASKGLDAESSCHIDGIVAADWSWEVRRGLIHAARGEGRGCNATAAIAGAQRMFISKDAVFGGAAATGGGGRAARQRGLCSALPAPQPPTFDQALALNCSLTSRKFPKPTVRAVGRLFTDCRSGLQLLTPAACPQQP